MHYRPHCESFSGSSPSRVTWDDWEDVTPKIHQTILGPPGANTVRHALHTSNDRVRQIGYPFLRAQDIGHPILRHDLPLTLFQWVFRSVSCRHSDAPVSVWNRPTGAEPLDCYTLQAFVALDRQFPAVLSSHQSAHLSSKCRRRRNFCAFCRSEMCSPSALQKRAQLMCESSQRLTAI